MFCAGGQRNQVERRIERFERFRDLSSKYTEDHAGIEVRGAFGRQGAVSW
jgi:hypothetical protein